MPAFRLQSVDNELLTEADLAGRWAVVFFGYTFCPDVCPLSLAMLGEVFERLGDEADRLQGLFVTVDPGRDSPEVLKAYVGHFDSRIVAATGSEAQVRAAAEAFGLQFSVQGDRASPNYTVDHPAVMLLFSPQGEFVSLIPHGATATEVVALLARYRARP